MIGCGQAIMVEAIGAEIWISLPDILYVPEYRLQPALPATFPSFVNSAVNSEPASNGFPFRLSNTHTFPVISPPDEPVEAQAAKTIKLTIKTIGNIGFLIRSSFCLNPMKKCLSIGRDVSRHTAISLDSPAYYRSEVVRIQTSRLSISPSPALWRDWLVT
jgi:hypothetical protein